MGCDRRLILEFGLDGLRQLLTELDAPLVVGVDVPNHSLREYLVLVSNWKQLVIIWGYFANFTIEKLLCNTDQCSERERRDFLDHNGIGRFVSLENFVGKNFLHVFGRHSRFFQFGLSLKISYENETFNYENINTWTETNLRFGFSGHKCFGLSQEVGEQNLMMDSSGDWIMGLSWCDEITRNQSAISFITRMILSIQRTGLNKKLT